jgi:hypothetical protein
MNGLRLRIGINFDNLFTSPVFLETGYSGLKILVFLALTVVKFAKSINTVDFS